MNERDRHIRDLIKASDKFKETFSGYWLNKMNVEIEWLKKYINHIQSEEANGRQLKLKL